MTVVDVGRVVEGIRRRARFARLSGLAIIIVLTAIGVGTALTFLLSSQGPNIYIGPQSNVPQSEIRINVGGGPLDWITELTRSFIRIAAVIMAVFIINILVSFARYNLRVANY